MNQPLEQWEYFTTLITAEMRQIDAESTAMIPPDETHPKYSPYALLPELNRLGQKGWELISLQPVVVGKNHDIMVHPNDVKYWSHTYLCAFKRRL